MSNKDKGELFVISAPSGAGKSSLIHEVITRAKNAEFLVELSVSATTRPPRSQDIEGEDYFFISNEEFKKLYEDNAFLESATVHGNRYGTLHDYVESKLISGINIILDIDVQGFNQIRDKGIKNTSIFIIPPSINELKERLLNRNQDSEEVIEERLKNAITELKGANAYNHKILNDNFDMAADQLYNLMVNRSIQNEEAVHISKILEDLLSN
ncbi:MAG: guanylate kinase [SAR86 cluster bacterium]|uniref:Guanylate kinase n=1 Tax=SAR86 cluster bacterium TaxID=2030880 RepID=A0A520MA21_9GAMM|nr:MAG: guanylate kinase [SAR86 cluster bacterium]